MYERFKCFNVNFRLLKTIDVHLLVCYLNKLQSARCKVNYKNGKDDKDFTQELSCVITVYSRI